MDNEYNRLIQVCSECGNASCWHGEFMCSNSRHADLELRTVKQLDDQHTEDKHHYSVEMIKKVFGKSYPFEFKE